MASGNYNGGHTILNRGKFAAEGTTIVKEKRYRPFSTEKSETQTQVERPVSVPNVVLKQKRPQKEAEEHKGNDRKQELDRFGIPAALETEGPPCSAHRAHYIGSDQALHFFQQVKGLIQVAARNGATYLADFQIALNDSKLRTLLAANWSREIVSCVIHDIRNEKGMPRPSCPKTPPLGHVTKVSAAIPSRNQKTPTAPAISKQRIDTEVVKTELRGVEARIVELEEAWDSAFSAGLRKKVRDQLDSKRRLRLKLLGMLSS